MDKTILTNQVTDQILCHVSDYINRINESCKPFAGLDCLAATEIVDDDGCDAIDRLLECLRENDVEPNITDEALYALLDLTKHNGGMIGEIVDSVIDAFHCKLPEPSPDSDVNFAVAVIVSILFASYDVSTRETTTL